MRLGGCAQRRCNLERAHSELGWVHKPPKGLGAYVKKSWAAPGISGGLRPNLKAKVGLRPNMKGQSNKARAAPVFSGVSKELK